MSELNANLGRILIVDDDQDLLELLQILLQREGFRVDICSDLAAMRALVTQYSFEGILLDLFLGDDNAVSALPYLAREAPFAKVIIMTAFASIERAVETMQLGATSFISKNSDAAAIAKELKLRLTPKLTPHDDDLKAIFHEIGLWGSSNEMQRVYDDIMQIRSSNASVLIQGESGTGKELVARAIHRFSPHHLGLFAALNCAAIPESLLESELFGHKKGAFTDAKTDHKGIFEACSDGTLFLDEIGDMPLSLQTKILRVLQEKEVSPLGSSKSISIQTRVISATLRNLEDEVQRGRFREDLLFRINVFTLYLPPLRERRSDIVQLANSFIQSFAERYSKEIRPISHELALKLEAYSWPGNVRELQNAIERAVVLTKTDSVHIEDLLRHKIRAQNAPEADFDRLGLSYTDAKDNFEKSFLLRVLKASKGSIAEAARISGRYRSDIYRLMERYQIQPHEFK